MFASLGPRPYVGGIENVVDTLMNSDLANKFQFVTFDTYRAPALRNIGAKMGFAMSLGVRSFKFFCRERPVAAHIHVCSGTDFWKHSICLLSARLTGVKTIFHLHGGSFDTFYCHLNQISRALVRVIFRVSDVTVALSSYWANFLTKAVRRRDVVILNNPVDTRQFRISKDEPASFVDPSILLLGSLGKRKGHYDLIRALPKILTRIPNVRILFAGGEEDHHATQCLKKFAAELGVDRRVTFLGKVEGPAKLQLLGAADIMVLPSYGENMPISIMEGMASSLPVVASNVGAIPEMLDDGSAGVLIAPGNYDELAEAIVTLLRNPESALELGKRAAQRARSCWDVKIVADRLARIYYDVMLSPD